RLMPRTAAVTTSVSVQVPNDGIPRAHAAERWARAVMAALHSPGDPRTLAAWGHSAGAARGTLRAWCRAAKVPAKSSLEFARLLRAVVRSQGRSWDPHNLLDVVDDRTMRRLLELGGLLDRGSGGPSPDCRSFMDRQRLVSDPDALRAVQAALDTLGKTRES